MLCNCCTHAAAVSERKQIYWQRKWENFHEQLAKGKQTSAVFLFSSLDLFSEKEKKRSHRKEAEEKNEISCARNKDANERTARQGPKRFSYKARARDAMMMENDEEGKFRARSLRSSLALRNTSAMMCCVNCKQTTLERKKCTATFHLASFCWLNLTEK